MKPKFPELSPYFNVDDIRKVRDYYDEIAQTMTWDEFTDYIEAGAAPIIAEIERRRAERKLKQAQGTQ